MLDAYTALGNPLQTDISGVADENKVSLTWNPVEDGIGYQIEADGIVINNGTATSYTLSGLLPNTIHFYRIRANYGSEYSQWSTRILKKTLTQGSGTGVRGEYYNNRSLTGSPIIITDPSIELNRPDDMGGDDSSNELSVSLPDNMFTSLMAGQGKIVNLLIGMADISGFSEEVRQEIGNRPVLELGIQIDGIKNNWSNPDTPVTISIDYIPTEEELKNPDCIVIRYIDGSNHIVYVMAEGIIKGDGNRVNPLSYTTRAEAAVIMYRIYNK